MDYNFKEIESKWQSYWAANHTFKAEIDSTKPKYYVLDMFPYPSGAGLHVGHPRSYTALDVIVRKKRMEGYNVLYPMGFDAFGLPAENYAIKTGIHPKDSTEKNIDFKVINGFAPNIFDVYTDANPAHTDVNFYIKHDRPDAMATISVQVFDLMGKLVWQTTLAGQSDMFISSPINQVLLHI